MATTWKNWTPTRPGSCYTDSQIRETPVYDAAKKAVALVDGSLSSDYHVCCVARIVIDQLWKDKEYYTKDLHPSQVTPYMNASRRTRQRWKAHTNNKCNDNCRFCRKDKTPAFAPQQAVTVSVPNPLPAPYDTFHENWKLFIQAINGKTVILYSHSMMGIGHELKEIPGWLLQIEDFMPADDKYTNRYSPWVPTAWLSPISTFAAALKPVGELMSHFKRQEREREIESQTAARNALNAYASEGEINAYASEGETPVVEFNPSNNEQAMGRLLRPGLRKQKTVLPDPTPDPTPAPIEESTMMQHPECKSTLQKEVAYHYVAAAADVARSKAQAEVNLAALTPGMMVWHAFEHQPCILIEQQEDGSWIVEDKKGERQTHVNPAILRPVKPNIFKRSWASLTRVACLTAIAYHNKVNSIGWQEGGATRASTAIGVTFAALATGAYLYTYGFNLPGPR